MRVLVTVNRLDLGGTQLNAIDFAEQLGRRGVESLVVGFDSTMPATGPTILDIAGARDVEVTVIERGRSKLQGVHGLDRLAKQFRPDLVHAYGGFSLKPAFWGPCRFGRLPLVMTVYEMYVPPYVYRRQPMIVGAKYLEEEQSAVHQGPVHLISPPVDLIADSPDGVTHLLLTNTKRRDTEARIVIVSRLADMKTVSISLAIAGMRLLDRPDATLIIVGDGPDRGSLEMLAEDVNRELERRAVVFAGAMADPRPAYADATIVLGMGGSAARALAFGKPLVVTGEHGWFRTFGPDSSAELFRGSFWSDQVDPSPTEALVSCLCPLIDDANMRAELGVFGRAFAEEHFGAVVMAERLLEVYEQALGDHRRRSWFLDTESDAKRVTDRLRTKIPAFRGSHV